MPAHRSIHRTLLLVLAPALLAAMGATPASHADAGRSYHLEMTSLISEKAYKTYMTGQHVNCGCSIDFRVQPGAEYREVSVEKMHYAWKTQGLELDKEVTPEEVRYNDNGSLSVQWKRGETKKNQVNPLTVFERPIGFLSLDGRGPGVVTRSPSKWVVFSSMFGFGNAVLLHRPALPAGELKPGQSFTADTEVPDPTYSESPWTLPVQWTVDGVSASGSDRVLELTGLAAVTKDRQHTARGLFTDGTLQLTSKVKLMAKTGELLSGASTLEVRWKKDPSGAPTGIMDYAAEARIVETPLAGK